MSWIVIMDFVIVLITQCQENRDRDQIERGLNKPGAVEFIALAHVLREDCGLRGKALRKEYRKGKKKLKAASPKKIRKLMARVPKVGQGA